MHASQDHTRTHLLEELDGFIWEADPLTLQFTYVSRGAETLLGYSFDDWLGPAFWGDLLPDEDRQHALVRCKQAIAHGVDHDFEHRVRSARGVLWVRDIVKVICDQTGRATLVRGLILNINESRRTRAAEDTRPPAASLLDPSSKAEALGGLVATMTREFNQTLATILGALEIALQSNRDAAVGRRLVDARDAASLGVSVSRQLLALADDAVDEPDRVDVHAVIEALEETLRWVAGGSIQLQLRLAASNPHIRLGAGTVELMLLQLTASARDAMPDGGVLRIETHDALDPTANITVVDAPSRPFLALVVSDTAEGDGRRVPAMHDLVIRAGGQLHLSSGPEGGTTWDLYFRVDASSEPSRSG